MVIFAHDIRGFAALTFLFHVRVSGVHIRLHVDIFAVVPALVVDQASRVVFIKILEHAFQGLARAHLVARGPHQNAGIVFIALQHADCALFTSDHVTRNIAGHTGVQPAAIVRLIVRLIHHIDTVFVAQLIEIRVVRIVRSTHGIQIVLLEQLDVRFHLLTGKVAAGFRRHLAAVYTLEINRFPIQNHLCIVGIIIDNPKLTETDVDRCALHFFAATHKRNGHAVEVRMLCVPLERVLKMARQVDNRLMIFKSRRIRCHRVTHRVPFRIVELGLYRKARCIRIFKAAQLHLRVQIRIHIFVVQIGDNGKVANLDVVLGGQIHIAVNTGQTNAVLVLNPAAVAPTEHLHCHDIFRTLCEIERIGDVKFLPGSHVLAIADLLAIDV